MSAPVLRRDSDYPADPADPVDYLADGLIPHGLTSAEFYWLASNRYAAPATILITMPSGRIAVLNRSFNFQHSALPDAPIYSLRVTQTPKRAQPTLPKVEFSL